MHYAFTLAQPPDIPGLIDMMRDLYAHDSEGRFDAEQAARVTAGLLSDDRLGRIFKIETDDEWIGYLVLTYGCSIEFGGRYGLVDELYIGPAHRRRGAGAAALSFAEALCRSEGIEALRLEVQRQNSGARALYTSHGFAAHDRDLMTKRLE